MHPRRKFLLQGSLASAVILATEPIKALSNIFGPAAGLDFNNNKLVLIHTCNFGETGRHSAIQKIKSIKATTANVVLLHAGSEERDAAALDYHVSMQQYKNNFPVEKNYNIIYRGNIKIGVIAAQEGEQDVIEKIKTLSAFLKNDKNCQLVVCLSQLGHRNKNKIDDLALAKETSGLDIIIGGNPTNHVAHTTVVSNRDQHEVIIQFANGNGLDFCNIEVGFDRSGNKHSIAINNLASPAQFGIA